MTTPYDDYRAVLSAIDAISQGETRTVACDQAKISIAKFERYIQSDPRLQEMYIDAERRGYDALADALIHIDNDSVHGQSDPKMAKVISDNIKWILARRDTKRFGDRIEVKHELTMDRAIIDALEAARNRTAMIEHTPRVIDVTPTEAVDEDDIMRKLLGV